MNMKSIKQYMQQIRDRLTIWAICRFKIPLPDLQQEEHPVAGRIYYYYGRWVKLVNKDSETLKSIRYYTTASTDKYLLNLSYDQAANIGKLEEKRRLEDTLSVIVCDGCVLKELGLPCVKNFPNNDRTKDQCFTHHYKLIKDRNYD